MIWLRRILAIPLIILFVITFVLGLVLWHLSGTVGSAGFYDGQMKKARVYDWIHESLLPAVLDEAGVESPTDFPIDTPELKEDILSVAETAFPPDWLEETFERASKQIVPYVVGDKNSFTITIDVESQIDPMAEGIKDVVDGHATEIYDYVTADLIVPAVTEQLALGASLPYGMTLTEEEIRGVVAQAMPEDWAIAQFKSMVDSLAAYLKGDVGYLSLSVVLTDVKSGASTALNDLLDVKLEAEFDDLPTCTLTEFNTRLTTLSLDPDSALPTTLPTCRPAGYSYEQFKQALETKMGISFAEAIDQNVIDLIPNSYAFDQGQLREALGDDMADTLESAREFIVDDGGQITDQDLRESDDGSIEEDGFDNARSTIHTFKMLTWVFWFVAILLLVAIGFLCGRNWKSRLLWPLCVLFFTSLVFVIIVAVARAAAPLEDRIIDPPTGEDATQAGILVADKADEMVHNAINAVIWGLEFKLILFIVLSGLAIAGVIAWWIVDRRRLQRLTQHDPQSPAP